MGAPARLIDLSVARPVGRRRGADRRDRHRRLHGAGAVRPDRYGAPGPRQRRLGPGRDAVRGGRRLPALRRGRPRRRDVVRRYPQLVDPPYELPDGVPHEVAKIVYAALEPDPADRPLPHEIAEALEPVLARQPPAPADVQGPRDGQSGLSGRGSAVRSV